MESYSRIVQLKGWLIHKNLLVLTTILFLLTFHAILPKGQEQVVKKCSSTSPQKESDCTPRTSWYNSKTHCCMKCSTCNDSQEMYVNGECSLNHDANCECRKPLYYESYGQCEIDCSLCATQRCISGTSKCECPADKCFQEYDDYCRNPIPCIAWNVQPTTVELGFRTPITSEKTVVPIWGFPMISFGIAFGIIIIIASLFLFWCYCPHVSRNPETEIEALSRLESEFQVRRITDPIEVDNSLNPLPYPNSIDHSTLQLPIDSNLQVSTNNSSGHSSLVGVRNLSHLSGSLTSVKDDPSEVMPIEIETQL